MHGVSAIDRYSYSSSFPSYRSSSSYLNRTTSLDRSGTYSGVKASSTPSYGNYSRTKDYSYSTRNSSTLPPKPSYSTDTYRNSRSLRVSPARTTYSRLSSDINGSISDISREGRYGSTRQVSNSRDSGYGSRRSSRDYIYDFNANDYTKSHRSTESERVRVSDRIKSFDLNKSDPIEKRLAERRKRLGLSPLKDLSQSSYSYKTEENNNYKSYRSTYPDTSKYSTSHYNGTVENRSKLTGGSEGNSYLYRDYNSRVSPAKSVKSSNNFSSDKYSLPDSKNVTRSSPPKPTIANCDKKEYRTSSPSKSTNLKVDSSSSARPLSLKETVSLKTKERRQKAKDRLSARLSYEVNDEDVGSRKSRTTSGSSFNENNGLVGLRNIGNTCFMNSITQCLSNTPCLLEYLLREGYTSDVNTTLSTMKGDLVRAFANLLSDMWAGGSDRSPINTGPFKNEVQRFAPTFIGYAQHDAQEFLRKLLEGLHEDVNRVAARPKPITEDIDDSLDDNQKAMESWKRYLRYDDSKIVDMFVGQLKSCLQCSVCNHRSVTFDPFWDLSLPIPNKLHSVKLAQCLELFTKEEVLDGNERPTCSSCKERRRMTKTFSIHKFPKVLVLHLKRFSPTERWRGKLGCSIEFPVDGLDLSKYAASMNISCRYRLIGVANHSGTALSGHYTAYCRHPYTGMWHEYNDSRVSNISSDRVCSSEAYVLFYELSSS